MASHSWDADNGIDIGGNCRLLFPSLLAPSSSSSLPGYYDSTMPEKIAQIFVDAVGAEIEKKRTRDDTTCWSLIPLTEPGAVSDISNPTYPVHQEGLVYPHGGKFEIHMAKQSEPKNLQIQTQVEFRIDYSSSCESDNGLIAILQSALGLVGWVNPVFGVTAATLGIYNAARC